MTAEGSGCGATRCLSQVQRIPLTDSGSPLASPMLLRQAEEDRELTSSRGYYIVRLNRSIDGWRDGRTDRQTEGQADR